MDKSVSIVIPVYNEEEYIAACLDSIARQTHKPDEVIVVDNNSSDSTVAIAKKYAFVSVVTEAKQGTVHARNTGFETAKGQLLARVDADSVLPPCWVACAVDLAVQNQNIAGFTGRPDFYDVPWPQFFNAMQVLFYQKYQKLLTGSYVLWGANMVLRREAWSDVRSGCSLRTDIDEDIDLSLCLRRAKLKILYTPDLTMGASLQRDRSSLAYSIKRLSNWPRDYLLHKLYWRAFLITIAAALIFIISSPTSLYHSFTTSRQR